MYFNKINLLAACCLSFSLFFFSSCEKEDDTTEPTAKNIVELAQDNADLSSLVAALTDTRHTTEFVNLLSGTDAYTVFAPTNAAFQALLDSDSSWNSLGDIPIATLDAVLKFHVISGTVKSTDLTASYVPTLSTGPNSEAISLQVAVSPAVKFNGNTSPVNVDIEASNGIVHTVDNVMLPPNVVTLALNGSGFTSLVAALTDARHTTDFVTVLSGTGPFTVFAPTNTAFQALLDSDSTWNSIGDIPVATLDKVLKYHVVNAANVHADQLTDNQEITMLSGGKVTIDLSSGAKVVTNLSDSVTISATDVQGTNGVIHVIDAVLLPAA